MSRIQATIMKGPTVPMRIYKHRYIRVDYPLERGYRMEMKPLPAWMQLGIKTEDGSKVLYVFSRIHVNKEVKMSPSYSLEWSDTEIIKDLSGKIFSMFLER